MPSLKQVHTLNKRDTQSVINITHKAIKKILEGWIRGEMARDAQGNHVSSKSKQACSWCMAGAVYCVSSSDRLIGLTYKELSKAIVNKKYYPYLYDDLDHVLDYNDYAHRTKKQVLSLMKRTITKLEKSL